MPDSRRVFSVVFGLALGFVFSGTAWAQSSAYVVQPAEVSLKGSYARTQLVVTKLDAAGKVTDFSDDLTEAAKYVSSDPKIVTVDKTGKLLAIGNGQAKVTVTVDKLSKQVPVTVAGIEAEPKIGFDDYVKPILSKAGCSMGACHASQYGKGGFKLSVFGFQPSEDWKQIVRDHQQRRVSFIHPEDSLLLRKPTMQTPHGGGTRLKKGSVDYQILVSWLEAGASKPGNSAHVVKLTVTPARRVGVVGLKQQLRVEAEYSDETKRDVTAWAKYDSMDEAGLGVTTAGMVTALSEGQAPIMIRFEGQADISMFVIPYQKPVQLVGWTNNNFVDEHASNKFRELRIEPSPLCDDATFVRRAFLDAIGTLPKPEETIAFIELKDSKKREKLIDRLLGLTGDPKLDIYNDQYAAYWTLKWSDLIRNTSGKLGEQGMWSLHNWIKDAFRTNKPFDQFVTELVTAKGSIYSNGPANYFRINSNASLLTESTAQIFMGIRLECAKCHHHPFEKYSMADYKGLSAFFSRVGTKNSEEFGLFGRETVVIVRNSQGVKATPLDGEPVEHPLDLRIPLAKWLTAKENEWFAKSVVNRYMSYLLGRGLVEPVDDLRSTNPPTNVALMDALAKDFADSDYNLKQLVRNIMVSRLYQLSSQPTAANISDRRFYSHYKVKRLLAEPLLDAIDHVTATKTKFKSLPMGTRAIELPDAVDYYKNYFLTTFAKPKRASVCECERSPDENLSQALHTLNGNIIAGKIADKKGRIASLMAEKKPPEEIVRRLYLAALSRYPSAAELVASKKFLEQSPSPQEFYEDLLWALMNSKQFLFVH